MMIMTETRKDVREPIAQVTEVPDGAKLMVELPGVPQDAIRMAISKDIVNIEAKGSRGSFSTVQVIPFEPDPDRVSVIFTQGVLEVSLRKKDTPPAPEAPQKSSEVTISIETLMSEVCDLKNELAKEREENRAILERLSFLHKDFQNLKRRQETEKEALADRKFSDIALELIDVLDSFKIARRSIPDPEEPHVKNMLRGIAMIENKVMELFSKIGVKRFSSQGMHFDPNLHEAVGRVQVAELEDEMVAEEIAPGYMYKGRALRPAKVKVNHSTGKKRRTKDKDAECA